MHLLIQGGGVYSYSAGLIEKLKKANGDAPWAAFQPAEVQCKPHVEATAGSAARVGSMGREGEGKGVWLGSPCGS